LIAEDAKGNGDLATFKAFLSYPEGGGQSLLATVFDEIFYGPALFEAHNGVPPRFHTERGLVEDEALIITDDTLHALQTLIGRHRLGIVSGRDSISARHTMGSLLPRFNSKAVLFLMDYEDSDEKESLRKPNPLPLLRAAAALEPFTYALYVGDSAEDILMAQNANRVTPRFISVGVYSLSDYPDELIAYLREAETDVIIPSVNHLPPILHDPRRDIPEEK
jgi:HAD superfamily hydrolase (TIGR01549 family)